MLNNAIGLLAIAALFGITGFQHRSERVPLIVFGALTFVFVVAAAWLPGLTSAYPEVGAFITGAFDDPEIYVVLGIGLFFCAPPILATEAEGGGHS